MNIFKIICVLCICFLFLRFQTSQNTVTIQFTPKVKSHQKQRLETTIKTIVEKMTLHISIPLTIIVYHCDPSLQSGHSGKKKLKQYEYIDDLSYYQHYMKQNKVTNDNRKWNMTYGAGATPKIPYVTICDASVLCTLTNPHKEYIVVHEIAHSLWSLSLKYTSHYHSIRKIYDKYKERLSKDCPKVYACQSLDEFFAVSSEVWFGATTRKDTTKGIETPQLIRTNFPELYKQLLQIYGPPQNVFQYVC